ncbi:MAG: GTPase Era [Actinobacteria bacterium]|nr:GTPase Era [Actinomycetota bacterium]
MLAADDGPPVEEGHRSGIVALAGRPNVGKSTLMNAMVGERVATVTDVPGTTRHVVRGILTRPDVQLVFVDTPGVLKPRTLLNARLNDLVSDVVAGVDVICLVVDAAGGVGRGDAFLFEELSELGVPIVAVVNKQDRVDDGRLLRELATVDQLGDLADIIPTSAVTGMNVERLVEVLRDHVPEGPRLFPASMTSDQDERSFIAEVIREKFIVRVFEEVPHSIAVVVDEIEEVPPDDGEGDPMLTIYASIHVERDSQKGIVIGKRGAVIREGNTAARKDLEDHYGRKVFLDVKVKVSKEWQTDPKRLDRLGF